MKLGVILESKDPEMVWNALRFGVAARQQGHAVHVFLMGAGVEIATVGNARYDVADQLAKFEAAGGTVLACGTCLKNRQLTSTAACPAGTVTDCVDLVVWADKTVTF
ncbi:DsrE family protein [Levilactobacillus enshiensis]|uniref:DsrE family protein n=1 Tax=Levilactobacillus enshiensis TaxID=2590213 RepID=UPI00117A76DE|nr:DsrE family protein [Levilactobacillus enshiensis]